MNRAYLRHGSVRPRLLKAITGAAMTFCLTAGFAMAQPKSEAEVKALWLVNIARFIEWPATDTQNKEPLHIAAVGENDLLPYLTKYQDQTINGRPIKILFFKNFSSQQALREAEVLYISEKAVEDGRDILDFVKSYGVFTVGERSDFIDQGGVMALIIEGGSIRYELNRRAASQERILISAGLLGRASRVVNAPSGGMPRE